MPVGYIDPHAPLDAYSRSRCKECQSSEGWLGQMRLFCPSSASHEATQQVKVESVVLRGVPDLDLDQYMPVLL